MLLLQHLKLISRLLPGCSSSVQVCPNLGIYIGFAGSGPSFVTWTSPSFFPSFSCSSCFYVVSYKYYTNHCTTVYKVKVASLPCGLLKFSDCQSSNILPLIFTLQYCLIPSFVIICDVKWKWAKYTIPHGLKLMHLSLFTKFGVPHFCSCITGRNCWHSDSFHIIKVLPTMFSVVHDCIFKNTLGVFDLQKLIGPSNMGIVFLPEA